MGEEIRLHRIYIWSANDIFNASIGESFRIISRSNLFPIDDNLGQHLGAQKIIRQNTHGEDTSLLHTKRTRSLTAHGLEWV